jgi:(2Fe-2S) ferredoxin
MKREAALAVVHDGVYYDTLTDEAARAIANIVLNS